MRSCILSPQKYKKGGNRECEYARGRPFLKPVLWRNSGSSAISNYSIMFSEMNIISYHGKKTLRVSNCRI